MSSPSARPASPPLDDVEDIIDLAHALADAAAVETLRAFRRDVTIDDKNAGGVFDPVTQADRAAERAMREVLAERAPSHGVEGEEFGVASGASPWTWVLDPIDGTRAYIAGLPVWTTLIAAAYEGRPVVGLIAQPFLGERFLGRPEGAIYLRGGVHQPMRVRTCDRLAEAVIATTDPDLFNGAEAAAFQLVRGASKLARYGCDAYAYAMLAAGRIDLVIESGLQTYDVAALAPVVRGAGGRLTDWRGDADARAGQVLASGAGEARENALVALRRAATP